MSPLRFCLLGYLSGSVLYARVFSRLMHKPQVLESSKDHNPGTANAFQLGGFWCGLLTLVCDLAKGFVPVFLFTRSIPMMPSASWWLAAVLAAPALGHIFPVYYRFHGGKGIAVTFGCLLGLFPMWEPFAILAAVFIFFSVGLRITPHYHRTIATYGAVAAALFLLKLPLPICVGFLIISCAVCVRLRLSPEERERPKVNLLWKR